MTASGVFSGMHVDRAPKRRKSVRAATTAKADPQVSAPTTAPSPLTESDRAEFEWAYPEQSEPRLLLRRPAAHRVARLALELCAGAKLSPLLALEWLQTPHPRLGHRTPYACCSDENGAVEALGLVAISGGCDFEDKSPAWWRWASFLSFTSVIGPVRNEHWTCPVAMRAPYELLELALDRDPIEARVLFGAVPLAGGKTLHQAAAEGRHVEVYQVITELRSKPIGPYPRLATSGGAS